jgi:hypothetical protein
VTTLLAWSPLILAGVYYVALVIGGCCCAVGYEWHHYRQRKWQQQLSALRRKDDPATPRRRPNLGSTGTSSVSIPEVITRNVMIETAKGGEISDDD